MQQRVGPIHSSWACFMWRRVSQVMFSLGTENTSEVSFGRLSKMFKVCFRGNFSFCTPTMMLRRCVWKKTRGQGYAHPYPQVRLYVILFRYISLSISIAKNLLSSNSQECSTQFTTPQKRLPILHQTQDEALLHVSRCRCSGRHTTTTPNVINSHTLSWFVWPSIRCKEKGSPPFSM